MKKRLEPSEARTRESIIARCFEALVRENTVPAIIIALAIAATVILRCGVWPYLHS